MNLYSKIIALAGMLFFVISIASVGIASRLVVSRNAEAQKFLPASPSEIAAHSTAADCWITISGKTYNVTNFLVSHPGGAAVITPYCGKDASQAYATKNRNPASPHSSAADSLLASLLVRENTDSQSETQSSPTSSPTPVATPQPASSRTGSAVAAHSTAADCWITISDKTYNVTNYLVQHPGGVNAITPYCGKDATLAFQTKNGYGSHSAYAQSLLANYQVESSVVRTSPTPVTAPTITTSPISSLQTATGASVSSVSSHSTASDCWVIINANIYNLTNYLVQHPGGINAITPYCGKDGSTAFNTKGGKGTHSNFAKSLLNNYLIGPVNASGSSPIPPNYTVSPTSIPSQPACQNLPAAICEKYPGAVYKSGKYEDDGKWEGKITTSSGACRAIKVNSSGSIAKDEKC